MQKISSWHDRPSSVFIVTKLVLFLVCRRIDNPSVQALAKDHLNDVISNSGAIACGMIGQFNYDYNNRLWMLDADMSFLINYWTIFTILLIWYFIYTVGLSSINAYIYTYIYGSPIYRGVHPSEAMIHFPPVSEFPLFPKNISDSVENFPNVTFSLKFFRFSPAKISDDLFTFV